MISRLLFASKHQARRTDALDEFALKTCVNSSNLPLFMDTTRIAELLSPFVAEALSSQQLQQLSRYFDLLLRWNAKTNLTAVRDDISIVIRHFGESLFAAHQLFPANACRSRAVIDLGSGAGFPGVPLKIYAPEVSLTLIESQNKKATFLKEVIRSLQLQEVSVFNGRAQEFPDKADVVTLRAVEHFDTVLPTAASLLKDGMGGRLALLIGDAQVWRANELLPAFAWQSPVPIPHSSARVLLVGTPARS